MPFPLSTSDLDPDLLAYLQKNSSLGMGGKPAGAVAGPPVFGGDLPPGNFAIPGAGQPGAGNLIPAGQGDASKVPIQGMLAGIDRGLTPAGAAGGVGKSSLGDLSTIGAGSSKANLLGSIPGLQQETAGQVGSPQLYDTSGPLSTVGVYRPFMRSDGTADNLFGRHEYVTDPQAAAVRQAQIAANAQMTDTQMKSQVAANEGAAGRNADAARQTQLLNAQQGFHQMDTQGRLDVEKLQQQGNVETAKVKAGIEHSHNLSKAEIDVMAGMNSGKINPSDAKAYLDAIRSQASPDKSNPGAGQSAGQAAAQTPIQAAEGVANDRQSLNTVLGALGTQGANGFTPAENVGKSQIDDLMGRMMAGNLNDTQRSAVVRELKSGKYGDPAKILQALAVRTAGSNLIAQPPTANGAPIDWRSADTGTVPGQYAVPGGAGGKPLLQLNSVDRSVLGKLGQMAGGGGVVPYRQLTMPNGQQIPVNPTDLYNMYEVHPAVGQAPSPKTWQDRAGLGNQLLQMWMDQGGR